MRPGFLRKLSLTFHVVSSVGWLGAVLAFLALAVSDAPERSLEVIAHYVIVPLAFSALISGIVQGLLSKWGVVQHYWVVVKLCLTLVATAILVVYVSAGDLAAKAVLHSAVALVILVTAAVLSIYKPPGRTKRGRRATSSSRSA